MKKIKLGGKYGCGKYALVDNDNYQTLSQERWFCDPKGYVRTGHHSIKMHHLVIGRPPLGFVTDHINGDRLDNQRANLRFATPRQNSRNTGLRSNNRSGYTGVSWHAKLGKWRVTIALDRKISLGCFDDPKEAAKVYNDAAIKYYGEFARLNPL